MHFKTNIIAALRFAAFATVLVLPICAQAAAYQVVVRYADLRLSNLEGARALLVRLKSAARQACGGLPERVDLGQVGPYQVCLRSSLDRAVAAVGDPTVSGLYHELAH